MILDHLRSPLNNANFEAFNPPIESQSLIGRGEKIAFIKLRHTPDKSKNQ